jgi:hypothetical protein
MTAVPDVDLFRTSASGMSAAPVTVPAPVAPSAPFVVEEAYWGYVVRFNEKPGLLTLLMQGSSWLLGSLLVVAALGLWFAPGAMMTEELVGMRIGLTAILASVGTFLLWFSSRGTLAEVQIDTTRGEVREVVRNRAGKPSLLGAYGFDAIGGVHLERAGIQPGQRGDLPAGYAELVLRYGNTAQKLHVVAAPEAMLVPLRDRLGRDLMVRPRQSLRMPLPDQAEDRAA